MFWIKTILNLFRLVPVWICVKSMNGEAGDRNRRDGLLGKVYTKEGKGI